MGAAFQASARLRLSRALIPPAVNLSRRAPVVRRSRRSTCLSRCWPTRTVRSRRPFADTPWTRSTWPAGSRVDRRRGKAALRVLAVSCAPRRAYDDAGADRQQKDRDERRLCLPGLTDSCRQRDRSEGQREAADGEMKYR